MNPLAWSFRAQFALSVDLCASLLGYALFVQYGLFLDPCPLCILQRVAFFALGVIFLIGALHSPGALGRMVYGVLASLAAAVALVANPFFSGMVRLQTERGHHVVSSGPYRWIRHPGYAAALITYLPTAILLDSTWAFVPAALIVVVLIVRTRLEDQFLRVKLDGYREYAARVRHRLLPGGLVDLLTPRYARHRCAQRSSEKRGTQNPLV